MRKKIICVDFDGVIHSYKSGWKGARNIPDEPVTGALQWLYIMSGHFDVQIYSARSRYFGARRAMKLWLWKWACKEWDLPLDPDHPDNNVPCELPNNYFRYHMKFPTKKPPAWITIDDRCFLFKGTFPTIEDIDGFSSWIRKEV